MKATWSTKKNLETIEHRLVLNNKSDNRAQQSKGKGKKETPNAEQTIEWQHTKSQAQLPDTYQKSYVLLCHACSLYVLIDCVLYTMQCFKQPYGSLVCGYYACEYLRSCGKFRISYMQLKKAQDQWIKEGGHPEESNSNYSEHLWIRHAQMRASRGNVLQ